MLLLKPCSRCYGVVSFDGVWCKIRVGLECWCKMFCTSHEPPSPHEPPSQTARGEECVLVVLEVPMTHTPGWNVGVLVGGGRVWW